MFWWAIANVETLPRVSQGGEDSNMASPCKSRGDQKEFRDGRARDWAST